MAGGAQRQFVTDGAETADGPDSNVGEVGVVPEGFARVHVAQVDLDERNPDRQQCVTECDARVRETGRVEDDVGDVAVWRLVDAVDQLSFRVALLGS